MAISNGGQCPQLNSGLGTSHGWLSSMWIERSDTLIHALGYNTTLFAGQSEGSYVLIFVPKKQADFETFNAVLKRGAPLTISLTVKYPLFLTTPLNNACGFVEKVLNLWGKCILLRVFFGENMPTEEK